MNGSIISTSILNTNPCDVGTSRGMTEAQWRYFDMNILTQKKCSKCGEWKHKSEFHQRKDKGKKETLRSWCKVCVGAWHHNFQKEHPEKSRVRSLAWRNRNLETAREMWHSFIASKPEGWDAERKRKRYAENRDKELERARVRNSKRRARILGNGGEITKQEWQWLKEFYDFTCLRCGKREPEIKLTLDHVLPLAMGGKNVIKNAQPLCQPCNSSKHNKHIDYRPKRTLM